MALPPKHFVLRIALFSEKFKKILEAMPLAMLATLPRPDDSGQCQYLEINFYLHSWVTQNMVLNRASEFPQKYLIKNGLELFQVQKSSLLYGFPKILWLEFPQK